MKFKNNGFPQKINYQRKIKCEIYRDSMQNYKKYAIPPAQLIITDVPYCVGDSSCWIVWDKDNGNTDFADCELAWTSFNSSVRKFKYTWNGMLQENMKEKEYRIHPTQKPVALYEWLLSRYAKQGDIILDTHCGSASSLIAAHRMVYKYLGFELDRDYYQKSKERLENEKAQMSIFDLGVERKY